LACSTYTKSDLAVMDGQSGQGGSSSGDSAGGGSTEQADGGGGAQDTGSSGIGAASGAAGLAGSGGASGSVAGSGGTGGSGMVTVKPTDLTFAAETTDVVHEPGAGGAPFSDRCPDGQVLIGFNGTVDTPGAPNAKTYLRSAQGICGEVAVSASDPYEVTVTQADPLPTHEIDAALEQTALCPENQVMTGFAGRSGLWMDSVDVRCAPLTILGVSPKFLLVVGTSATAGTIGGNTGGSPFDPVECAAGDIAVGQIIRSLYSGAVLGAFGVQCAKASLTLEPG
jgi:hypothetical protein